MAELTPRCLEREDASQCEQDLTFVVINPDNSDKGALMCTRCCIPFAEQHGANYRPMEEMDYMAPPAPAPEPEPEPAPEAAVEQPAVEQPVVQAPAAEVISQQPLPVQD